jgi:hypothetical protein
MQQNSTSGIRRIRWIRIRRWHSTCWHMAQCEEGVGWLLWWFALMTNFVIWEKRNATTRSEIWTMNIRSVGFWDIRECVTLWRSILQSLGCNVGSRVKHALSTRVTPGSNPGTCGWVVCSLLCLQCLHLAEIERPYLVQSHKFACQFE